MRMPGAPRRGVHPEFEVKPCPLCGGRAQVEFGLVSWAVVCPCSTHVFFGRELDGAATAEAWNRRA